MTESQQKESTKRLRSIAQAIIVLALVASLLAPAVEVWAFFQFLGPVSDFPEYYAAAKMALSGNATGAYDLAQLGVAQHTFFSGMNERIVGFYLPPPGLLFVMPFGILPAFVSATVWMLLQLTALVASLILLAKLFPANKQYYTWVVLFLFLSGPLYEALRLGQPAPSLLLCELASLYYCKNNKPVAAAIPLIFFAAKPQLLAPIIILLLGLRKYKTAIAAIVLLIIAFLLSLLAFGPQVYQSYFHSIIEAMKIGSDSLVGAMATDLNSTIRGQLLRITVIPKEVTTLISVLSLVSFMVLAYIVVRKLSKQARSLELGLLAVLPLGLLTSLHCHDYDLLLILPAILSVDLVTDHDSSLRKCLLTARLIFLLAFLLPIFICLHYDFMLKLQITFNPLFCAMAIFACASFVVSFEKGSKFMKLQENEP